MEVISIPQSNSLQLKKVSSNNTINDSPFIESNTTAITISELKNKCIIPVFSKDNERTISHQEFIQTVLSAISEVFPNQKILVPDIRVSHQIKGRTPEAINKSVNDLLEHEKTMYYERMAFVVKLPNIRFNVGDNELALSIGGVRNYKDSNLYSKKTSEKFRLFIGFQNKVCCNMCISTDGYVDEVKVDNLQTLKISVLELLRGFNTADTIETFRSFVQYSLTVDEFSTLVGKIKMYQHLPNYEKKDLFKLEITDNHLSTIVRNYYHDENFCREDDGNINLWKLHNLFTEANKSSYIDTFLARHKNITNFIYTLLEKLNGNLHYHWFLS